MKMLSNRTGGFLPALFLAVMLVLGFSPQKAQAQDYYDDYGNGDYQEFYDDLSPYGQWMNDPQYGYVWMPNVGNDFRPYYTNGQWAMTDYGNTWVSNYDWGWAPFHYGRWAQGSYGWIWIPGNTWGPAWVNWRQGGGYYGWAPMGPGVNINISFGNGFNVPNPWWTFIPCGNIYSPGWQRYYAPRRTVNIINNTTIINNTYVDNRTRNRYITGPRRADIEATTRQRVNVYNISNRTRSGATNISGRNVNVYRPTIQRTSGRGEMTSAPRQVKTLDRSVVTNTGGGRAPSRPVNTQQNDRANQIRQTQQPGQQNVRQDVQQRGQQNNVRQDVQQRAQQQRVQRDASVQQQNVQRDQQLQQQRVQRDQLQQQRVQQADQQRNTQSQRQQMQQQRDQQVQQQQVQRNQQMQQQRVQRDQQMQQQRVQQDQQMQQRRQIEQQRPVERAQPQQRVERSTPAPQPQRMERSAPAPEQRSVERAAPRGR